MSRASLDLCRTYLELSAAKVAAAATQGANVPAGGAAGGSVTAVSASRDLAAARMHLRGVLKQCEGSFSSHEMFAEMQGLLDEVTRREEQAAAAAKVA